MADAPPPAAATGPPLLNGVGGIQHWGLSPALDLQSLAPAPAPADDDGAGATAAPLSLLTCGAGDFRHTLKTLARHRRHGAATRRPLKIAVVEKSPEAICRHLLQLSIALDLSIPLKERVEALLEVMGNVLLRDRTAALVEAKSRELVRHVTGDGVPLYACLRTDSLKFKQRDELEEVLVQYRVAVPFEAEELREARLRTYYGDRYDSRRNVIDWDYNMKIEELGCGIVHIKEFRNWRFSGQSFLIRDAAPTVANRTLVSFAEGKDMHRGGVSVQRRGFWGDVVNGPYFSFGLECDDASMYDKQNRQAKHNAQEVAELNLIALLHELRTGEQCNTKERGEILGAMQFGANPQTKAEGDEKLAKITELVDGEGGAEDVEGAAAAAAAEEEEEPEVLDPTETAEALAEAELGKLIALLAGWGVEISFAIGDVAQLAKRSKFHGVFDVAFVSSVYSHEVTSVALAPLLKAGARVEVETVRLMLDLREEHKQAYVVKVCEMAKEAGLAPAAQHKDARAGSGAKSECPFFSVGFVKPA